MFSPLARGSANWDGGIHLEHQDDDILSDTLLLPQILLKDDHNVKSNKSFDTGYDNGRISLPKTYVTRKGALLLFTPSEELLTVEKEPEKPVDVYEDGLTLGTIGNLANSVLQFGKKEEQAWEGIPSTPPPPNDNQRTSPFNDRKAFLRFLHYLDSESLTADKHAQPGCDPDFYLDELRTSSRVLSSRRRSKDAQTPYSCRTYSSFLEDDDMSDIVRQYIKGSKLEKQLHQEQMDEDIQDNPDINRYIHSTSPSQHMYTLRSQSVPQQYFQSYEDTLRPSTAPLPPAPETPRANPRITSGKRPPPTRALGSKPDNLDGILRADIYPRRRSGPSPRLKFSRNASPTFYAPSSRDGSPEHGLMPQFETPGAMSEGWTCADDIIQEVAETEGPVTRPVSVVSYESAHSSPKIMYHPASIRASSGTAKGKDGESTNVMTSASPSASMSSVSYQKGSRSLSGKSRVFTQSLSRNSPDFHDDMKHDVNHMTSYSKDDSCVLCAHPPSSIHVSPRSMSAPRDTRTVGYSTSSVSVTVSKERDRVSSPAHGAVTQSRLSQTSSASSKRRYSHPDTQPSDGIPRAKSRGSNTSRMSSHRNSSPSVSPWPQHEMSRRGSGKVSRAGSKISENRDATGEFENRAVALRSRSDSTRATKVPTRGRSGQSRPVSAPISIPGDDANASLAAVGSEANMADVIEVMPRNHAYVDDVSDEERSLDSPDEAWPVNADGELEISDDELSGYGSAAEEVNLDLPSSPPLTTSGFFQLESSWSPVPAVRKTEDLPADSLTLRQPSEAGATGFQSRSPSPSPTPKHRTPALIARENDTESIASLDKEEQWPPETTQAFSPSATPATPIPTVTLNEDPTEEVASLRPTTPAMYQETIDIEKSRPSSPTTDLERHQPVSVSESVIKYLETSHEPAERPRSGRALKSPDLVEKQESISEENSVEEKEPSIETLIDQKAEITKTGIRESSVVVSPKKDKPKSATKEKLAIGMDVTKETSKQTQKESTIQETEARREYVNSLLIKSNPTVERGRLELEGTGKEGEEFISLTSSASTALPQSSVYESPKRDVVQSVKTAEPAKNDLSDLAALINRNKSAKATKEKKEAKKKPKTPKSPKKEINVDPQNIDYEAFNTPEMLAHMDDELKELIQQQNPMGGPSGETIGRTQNVEVPQVAAKVSPEKKNAHTPSKPKKPSKQELAKKRAEERKAEKKRKEEEKKRKEEEKQRREEELRLLKEKEEEQALARQEAEMKQKAIEEERTKRLAEEEEARREEEEAMEKLKDAKKKAREEREQRRAAEAERRKLEVQRKREEKKKREEEMKEKEKEIEQTKVDQEKRRQELMDAKKRQEELDRLEEERRQEEERLRLLEEEEEQRRLEEEQIREAEEELRRLQEEREYKEQMRRIAEAREQKLREDEEERLRQEEEERRKLEEERRKIEQQEEEKVEQEKRRIDIAKRLEAVARMRLMHEAARRKTMLLKRREQNLDRIQHLRNVRQDQGLTRSRVFSYYIRIPREVWEVPIGYNNQKKKGFRAVKKKPPPKA